MSIRTLAATAAALSLMASPAVAQAERTTAPASETSELANGSGLVLAILAIAAIIAGIIIVADGGNDDPLSA